MRDPGGSTGDGTGEDDGGPVELGVALLERLEQSELSVADVIDRIEAITTVPSVQRQILDAAERRGAIEREGATVRPTSNAFVRFESEVLQREGEFECERCGAGLSTGHFLRLEHGEVGPYGSSCIRKVTGRD
jgi:hypothetical protein